MKITLIPYTLQQCKSFENRLRFDKVTESLKVGTFLRHSVEDFFINCYVFVIEGSVIY